MDLLTLVARVTMNTTDFDSKMQSLPNIATSAGKLVSTALKTWIGVKAVGALKNFAQQSIATGKQFDSAMSQVAATMGTTVDQIQNLRDYAKEMGRTTQFTASQAAEAMNILAMAGYKEEEIVKTLPATLSLAAAGGIDIARAADYATGIMAGFGIEMDKAGQVGNILARIASSAKGSVSEFGEALSTVAGTASVTGQNMNDMTVALGILGNHNISAAEAGNALNRSLRNLYMATDSSKKALDELGVSAYTAEGKAKPLRVVLAELGSKLNGLNDVAKNEILSNIFDAATLKSVPFLINGVTDEWEKLDNAIASSWFTDGTLQSQLDSVNLPLDKLQANFKNLGVSGEDFMYMLAHSGGDAEVFAEALSGAVKEGVTFDDVVDALGGNLSVLQGAFDGVQGAAALMAGEQMNNLSGAMTIFSSAVEGAQIALSDKLSPALTKLVSFATTVVSGVTDAFEKGGIEKAFEALGSFVETGASKINEMMPQFVTSGVNIIMSIINGLLKAIPTFVTNIGALFPALMSAVSSNLPKLWETGSSIIKSMGEGFKSGFPNLVKNGAQAMLRLSKSVAENAVDVTHVGLQFILDLAHGIMDAMPHLVEVAPQVLWNFVQAIQGQMVEVTALASRLLNELGNGIREGLPEFLANASIVILELVTSLRENVGNLVDAGINFILNLAQGLMDGLPTLIEYVPQIVENIAEIINENAPKVLSAGWQLLVTLATGIWNALPTLLDNMGNIMVATLAVIEAINWLDIGSKILNGIVNGVKSIASSLPNALKGIAEKAVDAVKNIDWLSLGKSIVDGIISGIKSIGSGIGNAIMEMAGGAMNFVKNGLKIGSPSKVFADEIGQWIPKGIAEGIENGTDSVMDAMAQIPSISMDALNMTSGLHSEQTVQKSDSTGRIIELLEKIANDGMVTLEGDTKQLFKIVRKEDGKAKRSTGKSAFAY